MTILAERLRQALGTETAKAFAHRAGFDRAALSRWTTGKTEPSLGNIRRLADALKVSPGWLAFGESNANAAVQS